jgi:hypothetical protein
MNITRTLPLALLCGSLLVPAAAAADQVPNFKKKGDLEKRFVSEVCVAIIKAARTTAKQPMLDRYEYKEVKPTRTELHIRGKFSGAVTNSEYVAHIVVHIDTRDKNSWEVLRIDYEDNSKNIVGPNRKNLANLIKKFNGE